MGELAVRASDVEKALIGGDLSALNDTQRVAYYKSVCDSLGLNPLTKPFAYIKLNGKLTLYALRDAADQLRKLHGISIDRPEVTIDDGLVMVSVTGRDKSGRTDSDLGVVSLGNLQGEAKANAILKAITKAKRRLTLSIVGLGWLDETEVDAIPGAESVEVPQLDAPGNGSAQPHWIEDPKVRARFWAWTGNTLGLSNEQVHTALGVEHISDYPGTMEAAKAQIEAWVNEQMEPEQEEIPV